MILLYYLTKYLLKPKRNTNPPESVLIQIGKKILQKKHYLIDLP